MTEQVQRIEPSKRLDVLDYLRFLAAAVVLAFHYTFNGINNGKIASIDDYWPIAAVTRYGYLGVELFFLISGFVIFNSARNKTARQFAVGRAVRLYPAFWVAVLLTALVTVVAGDASGLSVDLQQVLVNLTMMPSALGIAPVDGVYWTLLVELKFYALVFLLILARQGARLGRLVPWWALGMLAIAVLAPDLSDLPYLGGYFPLFASGALIAETRTSGPSSLRVAGLLASATTASLYASQSVQGMEAAKGVAYSQVAVVALVLLFHLALLSMCWRRAASVRLPWALTFGALTYPLYLIHAHVGYMLLSHLATASNRLWVYPLVVTGVLGVAYLINVLVERRPKRWWFSAFDRTLGRLVGSVERDPGENTGSTSA
ncbi:acyltransferase family protein [Janibacter sp. G368]|uniref:acyltransferase family protein n=1 Tax=Janibacter sp. G368 TaxID=3420441 RepID=UPI003D0541FB